MPAKVSSSLDSRKAGDLWSLVLRPGFIDAQVLWGALASIDPGAGLDYRSRLLVHEALQALAAHWGAARFQAALCEHRSRSLLEQLWTEEFDEVGFPSLRTHLVEATRPEDILRMLRNLGQRLASRAQITVGGSSALMLARLIVRRTEDIDVVDELPPAIRAEPALVDEMAALHKLRLAHFASHYLPEGWEGRASSQGSFGRLDVRLLDPIDVLCGKLFSRRHKDLEDLQAAWSLVDQPGLRERLRRSTTGLRSDAGLAEAARQNWYILTGEQSLP